MRKPHTCSSRMVCKVMIYDGVDWKAHLNSSCCKVIMMFVEVSEEGVRELLILNDGFEHIGMASS